jgi:excisionase family DNA binding protein
VKDEAMVRSRVQPERLLTPAEVATLLRVEPKTVTRCTEQGKVGSIRTLGGHRRYSEPEIRAFLAGAAQAPRPASTRSAPLA